ncbi:MAG: hypothetical protein D6710_06800 [Nitrospirae bacterium]|nr:MAG: hypothetical protein D6710_06800 [Nitrospirota bacterium]
MLKEVLFVIITFIMGFLSAIPIGAVQVEVATRALHGHLKSAVNVSLGALTADFFYGLIAIFGLLPLLQDRTVMAYFWLFGGLFLIWLGYSVIKQGLDYYNLERPPRRLRHRGIAFVTGLLLAISNPMMILWWLFGERILVEVGLIEDFHGSKGLTYLITGCLGMVTYPMILSFTLYWLKRFFSPRLIMRITLLSGFILIGFSLYLVGKSLLTLLH